MKKFNYNNILLFLILLIVSGCFEERMSNAVWDTELLEWEPPSRATNALNYGIDLEAGQTENYIFTLRLQYAGPHKTEDVTGTFAVDQENSDAVEGEHFNILSGTSVTIPAGTNFSEEIEIEVLAGNIENGESFNIVLVITDEGDVPPMENYKEFNITIDKDDGFLQAIAVTINPPGNASTENMLDIATGNKFSVNDGISDPALQSTAEFGVWNSSSSDLTFMTPTSGRLTGFGSGRTLDEEWNDDNKNEVIMIKLPVSTDNTDLFENIIDADGVRDAFYVAEERAEELDLAPNDYGPGTHLNFIRTGELVFIKSVTREVYAVAYVDNAVSGGAGVGLADLLLKSSEQD